MLYEKDPLREERANKEYDFQKYLYNLELDEVMEILEMDGRDLIEFTIENDIEEGEVLDALIELKEDEIRDYWEYDNGV